MVENSPTPHDMLPNEEEASLTHPPHLQRQYTAPILTNWGTISELTKQDPLHPCPPHNPHCGHTSHGDSFLYYPNP